MDESFRKAVRSVVEQINPKLSRSCPFLDLAHTILNSDEEKASSVNRFLMYSKAPPVMMYVNQLLFYAGRTSTSQAPESEGTYFMKFFFSQSVDIRLAEDGNILEEYVYEEFVSAGKNGLADGVLREALLQAAKILEEQFCSSSPSPKQLINQHYSEEGDPQKFSEDKPGFDDEQGSIDLAFTGAIEAAVSEFIRLDHQKSSIQLMGLLIDEASRLDYPAKMIIGEWIVLSCMPHPEVSAGSDALLVSFYQAVRKLQSELGVEFPVEALMAAIYRLPAEKEVKLLLQCVIVEMIEKPETIPRLFRKAISMKMKFKVPKSIEEVGEPQHVVEISLPLFWKIVNMFSNKK